jgi:hypothetical protein
LSGFRLRRGNLVGENVIVSDSKQAEYDIMAVALNGLDHVMYFPDPEIWKQGDWTLASPALSAGRRILKCDSYADERRITVANVCSGCLNVELRDGSSLKYPFAATKSLPVLRRMI